jgi:hypothetical protein
VSRITDTAWDDEDEGMKNPKAPSLFPELSGLGEAMREICQRRVTITLNYDI